MSQGPLTASKQRIFTQVDRPNSRKRLRKLLKHFLQNEENFHQVTSRRLQDFGVVEWNAVQRMILTITTRSLGNWSETEVEEILVSLFTEEHAELRATLLDIYESHYRKVMDLVINEAAEDSAEAVLDAESGLFYSDYCFEEITINPDGTLSRSDAYIGRDGVVVFLKPRTERPSIFLGERVVRTAFRLGEPFWDEKYFLREKAVHFYKTRSLFLLEQHSADPNQLF